MLVKKIKWWCFKCKCATSSVLGWLLYPKLFSDVKLIGFPEVEIYDNNSIVIEENVTLNSINTYYHISMFSPVKLVSNTPNSTVRIGKNSRIHGSCIHAKKSILIGENVLIAANCQIFDTIGHLVDLEFPENRIHSISEAKEIRIGNNVWIGAGCIILPGVVIGDGAVVGAGSIVTKSIPPHTLSVGNPAKVIRTLRNHRH